MSFRWKAKPKPPKAERRASRQWHPLPANLALPVPIDVQAAEASGDYGGQ